MREKLLYPYGKINGGCVGRSHEELVQAEYRQLLAEIAENGEQGQLDVKLTKQEKP